ncbi:MAG: ABC transporter ATP-binding protein [Campylobacterales bacterium]
MLKASGLSHGFDYPLFENIDLELSAGESVAVLGVSGSGKSTLLHALSSFLAPQSGTVELFGANPYVLSEKRRNELRRNALALIFQQHYLFRGFSGLENLQVAALLTGKEIDRELLERLGIDHVLHQDSADLSGGQQQRLSIARVLIKQPKLIFADEPTGNLDRATAHDAMGVIFDYVDRMRAGFFLVTHDEKIAERATRRYRLENRSLTPLA